MSLLRTMNYLAEPEVLFLLNTTTLTSPLPNRDIIMKSKANNRLISHLLCTYTMDSHILMVGEDGLLNDDEANVLMISYMIEAVRNCKRVIRIISDDTNANYNKVTFRNYTLLLERRQPHNAMKIYWKLDKTFLLLFMVSQSARVWIRYMIYT